MPRYFFNVRIGDDLISDPEGQELRDPDQAWIVAQAAIRDLIQDETAGTSLIRSVMEVTNHAGDMVFEFPFSEALGN